ncbi:MAG: hypothetical protein ACOY0T_38000 [Myxococcota bacterium]
MNQLAINRTGDEWPDRWFVTNGVVAIGPVTFELLLRSVAQGRIPRGSFVRHDSWQVWRRLEEIGALSSDGRQRTIEDLATLSSSLELRAQGPLSEPPPPPSGQDIRKSIPPSGTLPIARLRSTRPTAVDPVGVLEHATEFGQALLLTLSTAAAAAGAEVGLVHRARRDLQSVVVVGGHGSSTEHLLGERLADDDPTLAAARAGHSVVSEPEFGENSRFILGRLGRCLPTACGVAMVPLLLYGELVAIFELGRAAKPFRAREVARAEDVVEALAARSVVMGWL